MRLVLWEPGGPPIPLLVGVVLLELAPAPTHGQEASPRPHNEWSAPTRVDVPYGYVPVSLAARGDRAVLMSTLPTPLRTASSDSIRRALPDHPNPSALADRPPHVIQRVGGPTMDLPGGTYGFAQPEMTISADGTLHMVWAAPPPTSSAADSERTRYTRLLYTARKDDQWTAVREIFSAPERGLRSPGEINWGDGRHSSLLLGPENALHLSVITNANHIHYLRRDAEGWSVVRTGAVNDEEVRMSVYADLAVGTEGEHLVLPFVGPAGERDRNSVFVTRSVDGGETWSTASPVHAPDARVATMPEISVDSSNQWHLAWLQSRGRGVFDGTPYFAVSPDAGTTWSEPSEIDVSSTGTSRSVVGAVHAAVGARGTVHMTFDRFGSDSDGIYHVRRTPTGWTAPHRLSTDGVDVRALEQTIGGLNRVHLAWLQVQGTPSEDRWPRPEQIEVLYLRQDGSHQ